MYASRMITSTALGIVLGAVVLGCRMPPSPRESSLSKLWLGWQPIQPAEKLEDHNWLLGMWHCKKRELLPDSDSYVNRAEAYVYLQVAGSSSRQFNVTFLMPDSHGRFGKRNWFTVMEYKDGCYYCIGFPNCDPFYVRRNPRNLTNEFIFKHKESEEYLYFERVAPERWDKLMELQELQEQIEWMYLGIPESEEYPATKFPLDKSLPPDKYRRVSKLQHVSLDEFLRDVTSGRAMYRNERSGLHYYSTEQQHDVLTLERKVYP